MAAFSLSPGRLALGGALRRFLAPLGARLAPVVARLALVTGRLAPVGARLAPLAARLRPARPAAAPARTPGAAGRRRRLIRAGAILIPLGALAMVVVWLSVTADDTMRRRIAEIPRIIVPVRDSTPAAPPDAEAPGRGAAPVNPLNQKVQITPAPAPGLVEETPQGPLPRIAADGRTPWQTYARPFVQDDPRPRIALVMAEMGLSAPATGKAIAALPGGVTLGFAPYAEQLGTWVEQARGSGHEVILALAMEPQGYPRDDPGPRTLLTALPPEKNAERLLWALSRVTGYVGVTSLSGTRFTTAPESVRPMLQILKDRGLLFLDTHVTPRSAASAQATQIGLPRAIGDGVIDRVPARQAIDAELQSLEEAARANGVAVGIASPYPVTIDRLAEWLPTLERKGLVLAPLSAVLNKQADR